MTFVKKLMKLLLSESQFDANNLCQIPLQLQKDVYLEVMRYTILTWDFSDATIQTVFWLSCKVYKYEIAHFDTAQVICLKPFLSSADASIVCCLWCRLLTCSTVVGCFRIFTQTAVYYTTIVCWRTVHVLVTCTCRCHLVSGRATSVSWSWTSSRCRLTSSTRRARNSTWPTCGRCATTSPFTAARSGFVSSFIRLLRHQVYCTSIRRHCGAVRLMTFGDGVLLVLLSISRDSTHVILVSLIHADHLLNLFCTTIDATVRTGIHVLVRLVYIFLGVLKYPVFEATHAHTAAR